MSITLADALAQIDVRAFYERHQCIVSGKPTHSREGLEYACSCCVCGGVDRASFWSETGRYCCVRGCRAHASNVYWFCRDVLNMMHLDALVDLGIDPDEIDFNGNQAPRLPLFLLKEDPPAQKWIDSAYTFCRMAEYCLWSSKGESARDYLHSRGFKDDIIKQAHLGLNPDWYKAPLEDWGLSPEQLGKTDDPQIKVPKGITIPYFVNGNIHKIQLRRPAPGPDGKHYKEILGSAECLYSIQSIEPDQPLLLAEGELDALSAYQEASDLVACVATGSAAKGLSRHHIGQIARASYVLQSFDQDEAGNQNAAEWLKRLPKKKARRWAPWGHDINDMLRTGLPVRLWVENGLQAVRIQDTPPALSTNEEEAQQSENISLSSENEQSASTLNTTSWDWMQKNERGLASLCFKCHRSATHWGNQGEPYCQNCCPWANEWPFNTVRRAS